MLALAAALLLQVDDPVLAGLRWLARHQSADGAWGAAVERCTCAPDRDLEVVKKVARDPEVEKKAKPLLEDLRSEDPEVRDRATSALAELGEPAQPYLEDAVGVDDPEVRQRARQLLHRIAVGRQQPSLEGTALALLAFLGAGYVHLSRDVHDGICFGDVVKRALQWLMSHQNDAGGIGDVPDDGVTDGNVLAALAMTEAYGLTGSNLLKDQAQKAVEFVVARQRRSGAWGAGRDRTTASLWSVTLLKCAKLSGLAADGDAIRRGLDWMRASAEKGGALEAAAYVFAVRLDNKQPPDTRLLAERVAEVKPAEADPHLRQVATLAIFQHDGPLGELWKQWNGRLKDAVVKSQGSAGCERGSWGGSGRRVWNTANDVLTLEVYYRYANVIGARRP